jgi:hypothetical protein
MSDKYIVVTTITHTRNTYVVSLDDIGDINLELTDEEDVDAADYVGIEDIINSSLISEDVVSFAIKDYSAVIEHLETTEGDDVADYFQELEDEDFED